LFERGRETAATLITADDADAAEVGSEEKAAEEVVLERRE